MTPLYHKTSKKSSISSTATPSATTSSSTRPSAPAQPHARRSRRPLIILIVLALVALGATLFCLNFAYRQGRQRGADDQRAATAEQVQALAAAVRAKSTYVDQFSRLHYVTSASDADSSAPTPITELNSTTIAQYLANLEQLTAKLSQDSALPADLKSQAQSILATYREACTAFQSLLEANQQDDQAFTTLQDAAATAGQQLTDLFNQNLRAVSDQLSSATD